MRRNNHNGGSRAARRAASHKVRGAADLETRSRAKSGSARRGFWQRQAWQIGALWILAFLGYSNSFGAGLVFDNEAIIAHDARIRAVTLESIENIFTQGYWPENPASALYRPLTTFSYLLDCTVLGNGLQPAGYHIVNLAIHDLNTALVYMLGLLILGSSPEAFALAALWALHPLLTESVTNIVGRADELAALGVLAGLLFYIHAVPAAGRKRVAWLAGLVVAQTVGLFSKENAVILPAAMLLYDVIWARKEEWRRRILPYAALLLPFGAFSNLRSRLHLHLIIPSSENPLATASFWTARMTAVKVIGKFLWLFAWPARLSADYSFNAIPLFGPDAGAWENAHAVIALAAVAGLVVLAIRFRKRSQPFAFFAGFFFIALAPTANLFLLIGSIMAERFMYLPALGLAGCVVVAARQLKQPAVKWAALGVMCLPFGARTYARNYDWHDSASLWSSTVAVVPESARPHNNLGNVYLRESEIPEAIAQYQAALRIRPDYAEAQSNLGIALAQAGRLPQAIAAYQAALRDQPDYGANQYFINVHTDLGNALARLPGRTPDAIEQYQEALKLDPNMAATHYDLGNAFAQTPGRMGDAVAEWQAALRIQPDLAQAHYNLGVVYAQSPGRLADAVAEYQAALRVRPDHAETHYNLGSALSRIPGRMPEAIAEYEEAARLRPDFWEAHYSLGLALMKMPGRMLEAINELQAALRIHPDPNGQRMLDELRERQH